jgi:hypothetical protein
MASDGSSGRRQSLGVGEVARNRAAAFNATTGRTFTTDTGAIVVQQS